MCVWGEGGGGGRITHTTAFNAPGVSVVEKSN